MNAQEFQRKRSFYINLAIDILSNLNYNEISFVEDRAFIRKLQNCYEVDLKTLDI